MQNQTSAVLSTLGTVGNATEQSVSAAMSLLSDVIAISQLDQYANQERAALERDVNNSKLLDGDTDASAAQEEEMKAAAEVLRMAVTNVANALIGLIGSDGADARREVVTPNLNISVQRAPLGELGNTQLGLSTSDGTVLVAMPPDLNASLGFDTSDHVAIRMYAALGTLLTHVHARACA